MNEGLWVRGLMALVVCACGPSSPAAPDATPGDCLESGGDSDGDGVCDDADNCPTAYNLEQVDVDEDGVGDACDPTPPPSDGPPCDARGGDLDGDDWCGVDDNCPNDSNPRQSDSDGDGWGDACDPEVCNESDDDGDGSIDEGSEDVDGDGVFDCVDRCAGAADEDTDGDGVVDCLDECPRDPDDDADGDGICAPTDNCPDDWNYAQTDLDGNGVGNVCDTEVCDGISNDIDRAIDEGWPDEDGDGLCDEIDPCLGDPINDPDGDGLCGAADNCPRTENADQSDADDDGFGDACDLDFECGPAVLPADPGTVPIPDDLRVTDMVAGPGHSILYVGGANGAFVHRIVAIDGATRSILWALPVGNEPSVLAISNDGTRLYVGSTRASTIRAVDLTERRACRTFALDPHGVTVAMAVPATAPQTVLVASSSDTLAAYDSGVRRPEIADASVWPGTSFAVLGATDAFVGDSDRYAIDWRGVRWLTPGPPRTVHRTVQLAGGLLYSESGAIIDPAPPAFVRGWLPVPGPHVVDPSIQRAFTAVYPDLIVTDLTTLLEVRREPIGDFITVHDMVRWGADGVALRGSRVGEIGNLFLKSGVVRP